MGFYYYNDTITINGETLTITNDAGASQVFILDDDMLDIIADIKEIDEMQASARDYSDRWYDCERERNAAIDELMALCNNL